MADYVTTIIGKAKWCKLCGAIMIGTQGEWEQPELATMDKEICDHGLPASQTNSLAQRLSAKKSDVSPSSSPE